MRGWIGTLVAAVALAALVACTRGIPYPDQSPGPFEGELVSRDDAVPAEFPDGFPLPGDPTVVYSAVSSLGSVLYLATDTGTDALVSALLAALPPAGWTVYACARNDAGDEPVVTIVAGEGRRVASVVVGYAESFAERLEGDRYSYFVSVADDAPEPQPGDRDCEA